MRQQTKNSTASAKAIIPCLILLSIFMTGMKNLFPGRTPRQESQTYLALGDSYTIGEQVVRQQNFPSQIVDLLNAKGKIIDPPKIVAQTGWTTDELESAIARAGLKDHYDFVTLLIGVNNQYRGRSVENYIPEFESLLQSAIKYAGGNAERVIVLSIPDWGVTPFAAGRDRIQIAREIDAYNEANATLSKKYNVQYINITPGSRQAANDLTLLAADQLHPSAKEYSRWAMLIASYIEKKF